MKAQCAVSIQGCEVLRSIRHVVFSVAIVMVAVVFGLAHEYGVAIQPWLQMGLPATAAMFGCGPRTVAAGAVVGVLCM